MDIILCHFISLLSKTNKPTNFMFSLHHLQLYLPINKHAHPLHKMSAALHNFSPTFPIQFTFTGHRCSANSLSPQVTIILICKQNLPYTLDDRVSHAQHFNILGDRFYRHQIVDVSVDGQNGEFEGFNWWYVEFFDAFDEVGTDCF